MKHCLKSVEILSKGCTKNEVGSSRRRGTIIKQKANRHTGGKEQRIRADETAKAISSIKSSMTNRPKTGLGQNLTTCDQALGKNGRLTRLCELHNSRIQTLFLGSLNTLCWGRKWSLLPREKQYGFEFLGHIGMHDWAIPEQFDDPAQFLPILRCPDNFTNLPAGHFPI